MVGCGKATIRTYRKVTGVNPRFRKAESADGKETTFYADKFTRKDYKGEREPKPVIPSVKCPHCGRKFNLVKL
jgi:hypothetical protein